MNKDEALDYGRRVVSYAKEKLSAVAVVSAIFSVAVLSFTYSFYLFFGFPTFLLVFGITVGLLTGWIVIMYLLMETGVARLVFGGSNE